MSNDVSFYTKYRACQLFLNIHITHSDVLKEVGYKKDPRDKVIWGWLHELQSLGVIQGGYLTPFLEPSPATIVTLQKLNGLMRLMFPQGSSERGFPIRVGDSSLRVVFFRHETDSVSFGLFLGRQYYSRKTITIYNDGRTAEDIIGIIPASDKTNKEPCFAGLEPAEIALMVGFQLKALAVTRKQI